VLCSRPEDTSSIRKSCARGEDSQEQDSAGMGKKLGIMPSEKRDDAIWPGAVFFHALRLSYDVAITGVSPPYRSLFVPDTCKHCSRLDGLADYRQCLTII
jgi:hypothetical protein